MAIPSGQAIYKKKDGILTLTEDWSSLIWKLSPGTGPPTVSLLVSNISNLQKTPDSAPKVILKVFEKPREEGGDAVTYMFQFNSPNDARAEGNVMKDVLQKILSDQRSGDPNVPKPHGSQESLVGDTSSASMSFAATAVAKRQSVTWFDDGTLLGDTDLQQSLMKKDELLGQTFADALAAKPASLSESSFRNQFWQTRINQLRAHAIEMNQKKGAYNVLSTVKPRIVDNELKLSINLEQVQLILQQHPLVKRIYNENVPRLSENQFWSRFFLSRLCKKLRGERVMAGDNPDPLFDRYEEDDNNLPYATRIKAQRVPHMIDLAGNEENQGGFRAGNQPDWEMRPRNKAPIIQTLNSLSEKLMAHVAPADIDPAGSKPTEEGTFRELYLRDLQDGQAGERIVLDVREQKHMQASKTGTARPIRHKNPADVLLDMQTELETVDEDGAGGLDLHKSIGVDDDSESESEAGRHKAAHVGSRAARRRAQEQLLEGMRKSQAELAATDEDEISPMGIPPELTQRCCVTNATTTEFLRHFWKTHLARDPKRAVAEIPAHAEALRCSRERIDALAREAEALLEQRNIKVKAEIKALYQKTGRRTRWQPIREGGRDAVLALFESTLNSIRIAQDMMATEYGTG